MRTLVSLLSLSLLSNCALAQAAGTKSEPASQPSTSPSISQCTDLDGHPEPCPEPIPPLHTTKSAAATDSSLSLRSVPYDIIHQQVRFWTTPARLRERDLRWAFPFAIATTTLMIADPTIDEHIAPHTSLVSNSQTFSNVGVAVIIGSTGGMYLWGHMRGNDKMRNTGIMAGEAGLDSFLASTVMKEIAQRARPMDVVPPGSRGFFQGGSSFPSEHSAAAWSVASVVAHQYPGTGTKLFAYGLAAAISASRVTGRQHFSSDAFIGSALGWYMGRQVWEGHQVPDAKRWGTFEKPPRAAERNPNDYGSPYVPLDSWVYPAFDRLFALGYMQSGFIDLRPWTRMECARLVEETGEQLAGSEANSGQAVLLYKSLKQEFAPELDLRNGGSNTAAVLDSFYTRVTGISGTPLRDGYHFGQTIVNDYGRPYGEGLNLATGFSSYATTGPLSAYVRAEYQRAPSAPYVPVAAQAAVSQAEFGLPLNAYPTQFPATSQLQLVEGYVSLNVGHLQMSFGKQALWWGPAEGGGLILSDNAESIPMLRINRTTPFRLPSVFGLLGPMRTEFFIGQLSGHNFVSATGLVGQPGRALNPQPYFHGVKFSFKPTPNFEFSVATTAIFAGESLPFTSRRFLSSMFSFGTQTGASDPGKRQSQFDFTYRIPKLRKWLTLYTDSLNFDEVSPLGYPRTSAMNPGIYMPQIPKIPKLDFRMEGVYTPYHLFPGFFYFSVDYPNGYTNKGQLMGNWIGRQGTGVELWSNYSFSARSKIGASYRTVQVDRDFLQGGTLKDFQVRADMQLRPNLSLNAFLQIERWNFPILAPTAQTNVVSSVQLTYWPHWRIK